MGPEILKHMYALDLSIVNAFLVFLLLQAYDFKNCLTFGGSGGGGGEELLCLCCMMMFRWIN